MARSKRTINFLFLALVFFFFANFVAQKKDSTAGYGELGSGIIKAKPVTTTGGVFDPEDRTYVNENTPNRRFVPYSYLRQADVSWEKRIWRVIDLREKINQPMMFPLEPTQNRRSFVQVLKDGIRAGAINMWADDEFSRAPMDTNEIFKRFSKEQSVPIVDSAGNKLYDSLVKGPIENNYISKIVLKEDWFFDKQRSVLDVRVLGIGVEWWNDVKQLYIEIGWFYYPQCRPWFAKFELYNPKNDAERRTYEDFFWKRLFNSYIKRETNVFERQIMEYAQGLDALIEADRVKGDIFRWEHDLWHF